MKIEKNICRVGILECELFFMYVCLFLYKLGKMKYGKYLWNDIHGCHAIIKNKNRRKRTIKKCK